jgi:hypothetical protein
MRFTHLGKRVELKGIKQQVSHCTAISTMGLQQLFNREAVQHCVQFKWDLVGSLQHMDMGAVHSISEGQDVDIPDQIQTLLNEFVDLFQ